MILDLFSFRKTSKADKILSKKITSILGFKPRNISFYKTALIHSSATVNDSKFHKVNNERLEFVGDAVINMVVTDLLYKYKPDYDEGNLTIIRSKIVSRKNLNRIAQKLILSKLLICRNTSPGNSNNILGNALEALFGAIYFDRGYRYCKIFAKKILLSKKELNKSYNNIQCYKSQIIDFAQKNKIELCFNTFECCESNEKEHHYICELLLNNNYLISGKAWSKKQAEQNCAQRALKIPQNKILEIAITK